MMYTKEEVAAAIEKYISEIEYPANPDKLYGPIRYAMEGGGKRIRPMLVVMAANIFSDDAMSSLPAAAAIEMFHTFTLLHDDIMDNADMRRGKSTVHKHWNQNTAILSGDALLICSHMMLENVAREKLPEVQKEFNKLALEVCEGQQYDIDFESRDEVPLDEYMNMIRLKTAVLMAGACKIGAIIGGAGETESDTLYRFGLEFGFGFQLQDDYLDTYGTTEILGKNIGGDIEEKKKTFLTINALNEAGDATRRAMLSTLEDQTLPLSHKISRIRTIYNSLDIPAITLSAIEGHFGMAVEALDELGVPAQRTAPLRDVLAALSKRNK